MAVLQNLLSNFNLISYAKKENGEKYRYEYDLGTVDFISAVNNNELFFNIQNEIWCENKIEFYLVVFENNEIHICDGKSKPTLSNSIKNATIESFIYGKNDAFERKYLNLFKKENIDNGECLREINEELNKRNRITVDNDLLENLKKCRVNLIKLISHENSEQIAQKLIDRCLFIRFIEDRAKKNNLKEILGNKNENSIIPLLNLFDFYNSHLDGDIFEPKDIPYNLDMKVVEELNYIFGEFYFHSNRQGTLFPYKFSHIPIILISHIYEEFLGKNDRSEKGIVFTPENIVDAIIEELFSNDELFSKIINNNVRILDPSCGSGIFLVKILDKIFKNLPEHKKNLDNKIKITTNAIHGIDVNKDALRIAALSIYLKLFDGETSQTINQLFENDAHILPKLKQNGNLICRNTLFDDITFDEPFDLIIGNPPWGYLFNTFEKQAINRLWPEVTDYQSSQCFILQIGKWMSNNSISCMVLNISIFLSPSAKKFRASFLSSYSISKLVNISNLDKITWKMKNDPSCIVFFKKDYIEKVKFYAPKLTNFMLLTKTIYMSDYYECNKSELINNDEIWHVYLLGYGKYSNLVTKLDKNEIFNDQILSSYQGFNPYSKKKTGLPRDIFYEKYTSKIKINSSYYAFIRNIKNIKKFIGRDIDEFILYGDHFERDRDIKIIYGNKLIFTRRLPLKVFMKNDPIIFDTSFNIIKLKNNKLPQYLLFEAIFNSKLADFYFGIKYILRETANYATLNLSHIKHFPIPNIISNKTIVNKIVESVLSYIKNEDDSTIDELIFKLYDIDYLERLEIEDYFINKSDNILINSKEIQDYCQEFKNSFKLFIKDNLYVNCSYAISDFFGTMVLIEISEENLPITENRSIMNFIRILEKNNIKESKRNIFWGKKIRFYDDKKLYIYKSNHPGDWTKFEAITDTKQELVDFFNNME
jgi:hypothetical protein